VAPSSRNDIDIDYTFVQIGVRDDAVDFGMTCGNMASAVGPFAIDEGLVTAADGPAVVRIYNTNTDKVYHAHFAVSDGEAVEAGDAVIPGVSGAGAPVDLEFLDPSGARTKGVLPTGRPLDRMNLLDLGAVEASCVDSTNPVVFLRAADLGVDVTRSPQSLDADDALARRLEAVRRRAAVLMGMAATPENAFQSNPKIGLVVPPQDYRGLDGAMIRAAEMDIIIKMVSMGNFHRAIPLSSALCAASAAALAGTLVQEVTARHAPLRIGTASGVISASAKVERTAHGARILSATTRRTQRRLFAGRLPVPAELID